MTVLTSEGSRALVRVLIAGYVDAYALLNFGVYASFMTGNTTSGGVHAGQGNLAAAGHSLLPIPCFLAGILAGSLLLHADQGRALRRNSVLVAALLGAAVSRAYFAWPEWLGIVLLSGAMGLLNTSVTEIKGQPVSLGFMTGDLNNMARHVAKGILRAPLPDPHDERDTHWTRAWLLGSVWALFLVGAALGAVVALHVNMWTLLIPALLLLLLSLAEPQTIGNVAG
jgi:uncharacterized membrane protein YoaK (UPF0700 family)